MEPYATTADLPVPSRLIDQIVGQDAAVEVVRLAARQRRYLLLIGDPGTGKSMLGRAVADLMPTAAELPTVISVANKSDPLRTLLRICTSAEAEALLRSAKTSARSVDGSRRYLIAVAFAATVLIASYWAIRLDSATCLCAGALICFLLTRWWPEQTNFHLQPKILVAGSARVPFVDATGCTEGSLFGDVRHDPYQSGGVETAAHQLVEAGAIHRAHGGVLYIDELSTLKPSSQELLLTALQDKQLAITGRSAGSSGTMIMTPPVPCDFVLVLAGNQSDLEALHPALRSRLQGYGYELCTRSVMPDDAFHRGQIAQLAAQEIRRDGRIPHADQSAVEALVAAARARSETPGTLSTRFRELGGLLRIAGDLAVQADAPLITAAHVADATKLARTVETQLTQTRSGI